MPPALSIEPMDITVKSGEQVIIRAHPHGGEAILFSVDWSVLEGQAGGTIVVQNQQTNEDSYVAVYEAPTAGNGPFHVIATLHEYPVVNATATIHVTSDK